ncbi:YgiT-type zinc finger protein [Meridianimarinicoccus zhengii]|uniref:YgiT-type zinc finger protein n=1 Tax=Meridianimarinicoccus zhengii TaxID=2056810 RepID=UPI000DAC62D7|nr:YgiT-type zinc finger protein [Phycocomes zhengii]
MPYINVSNVNDTPDKSCPRCGSQTLIACETTTSIWSKGRLCVIEHIAALHCVSCEEILVDGKTAEDLRLIAQTFPKAQGAFQKIEVPVISFRAASLPRKRANVAPAG